jgi:hypothetical protein
MSVSPIQEDASASAGPIQQAQEKVGEGVEQAKHTAAGFVRSQVDERSTQIGEQLQGAVQALRQAGETMKQEGTPGSQLVEGATTQVERTARYLSESDGRRLLNDLERVGRQNPWGVIAGGIALGFVAARFLKASSSKRFEEYRTTYYSQLPSPRQLPHPSGEQATQYAGSAA